MNIQLGNQVRDIVSGVEGIAFTRLEYINGSVEYGVQLPAVDNVKQGLHYIDEGQLEVIDDGVLVTKRVAKSNLLPERTE